MDLIFKLHEGGLGEGFSFLVRLGDQAFEGLRSCGKTGGIGDLRFGGTWASGWRENSMI